MTSIEHPPASLSTARHARERTRSLARLLRRVLVGTFIAGGGLAIVMALRPKPISVDLAVTQRGPLSVVIQESGVTRVKDRYLVSASVSGHVSRLSFEPGDSVKEGQPLAEIAPALSPLLDERARIEAEGRLGASLSALGQTQAQAERARAAHELSVKELDRLRSLAGAGAVPRQTLEQAEFEARMREEELASSIFAGKVAAEEARVARVTLGRDGERPGRDRHVDVLAPASGEILRILQKSAGVVQAGAPLVEVGDPASLEIVVDLLTTDAVHVEPGTPVVIQGWGGDHPLSGRVRRIEPSAFTRPSALGVDEQRVNVIVALTDPRNQWTALADGYHVEARIILWQSANVVKVPQGAVFRHGGGWAVFCSQTGTAKLTPIEIGHRGDAEVEVISGLARGASVIDHPGDAVKDGVRVEARAP